MSRPFKRRSKEERSDSSDTPLYSVPPGKYIVALVWFQRRVGKESKRDFLRWKFVVCTVDL